MKNKKKEGESVINLAGYSLVTAEITYRLPDHLLLLQKYIWQDFDLYPDYPKLHKFLEFWQSHLDGPIHSVAVCHLGLVTPTDLRSIKSSPLH